MFHLVLSVCLTADPAICAERLLPAPMAMERAGCEGTGAVRAAEWAALHPELAAGEWRCLPLADLPALSLVDMGGGLYLHPGASGPATRENRGEIANLGVIIGAEAVAVIDAGASRAQGEALFAAIRGLTDRPIRHLILTHMHPDHVFGASPLREAGADIIAHPAFTPALSQRAGAYMEGYASQFAAQDMLGTRLLPADRAVDAPELLALGPGHSLRISPVPTAHTDNDLTVLHVESGTLFAGDLVFGGLLPSLDGSVTGWLNWLEGEQPDLRRLVPGHGPAPLDWPEGADPTRAYLTLLRDTMRAAIAQGQPMSRAIDMPLPDDWFPDDWPPENRPPENRPPENWPPENWAGAEEIHPRNAAAAYKELEWE